MPRTDAASRVIAAPRAQVYAALGYAVVPMHTAQPGGGCSCPDPDCPDPGKHPRLRGWQRLYVDHVLQADKGVDLDFLVGRTGSPVPRDNH